MKRERMYRCEGAASSGGDARNSIVNYSRLEERARTAETPNCSSRANHDLPSSAALSLSIFEGPRSMHLHNTRSFRGSIDRWISARFQQIDPLEIISMNVQKLVNVPIDINSSFFKRHEFILCLKKNRHLAILHTLGSLFALPPKNSRRRRTTRATRSND